MVDSRVKPVGTILPCKLLKGSRNVPLVELMNYDFMAADTHTKLAELAFIFKQYAITMVPETI